jgi:hypothetical protein
MPVVSRVPLLVRRADERPLAREVAMQYALLVYVEPGYVEALPDAERDAVYAEYLAVADDARCVGGAVLRPAETATCVRVAGGRTLMTDGPFADTKEVLGSFALVEAANLDEAIELAARFPAARLGGVVEVRPVVPR